MPDNFTFLSGTNVDTRSASDQQKDYKFQEIVVSAAPVNWVEKTEAQWRKFPDQEQDGSGSCVAQTIKKLACISLWLKEKVFVIFSATHIYQRRSNKPTSGMIGVEAFNLWKDGGITLEQLAVSENMNDSQMDAEVIEPYKQSIGTNFKIGGHVGIDSGAFETVASVIQETGKGVMAWFYFTGTEWSPMFPVILEPNLDMNSAARHSVAVVDFCLHNGKKYLIIEDSAHFGGITRRLISEEFFKARNWLLRYPMNFSFNPEPEPSLKPKYTFTKTLNFGMTDPDVIALQNILKFEGLFATNIASTGYYGAISSKAVLAWQKLHNVAPNTELDPLMGRSFGPKSVLAANSIYS